MAGRSKPRQCKPQKKTVGRVMHELKHGELERGQGGKVKSRRQAIAIALSEAGASKHESSKSNRRNLRRSKGKECRGETAQAQKEGRQGARGARIKAPAKRGTTRADLYEKAKKRNIPGRSRMSKAELEKALGK